MVNDGTGTQRPFLRTVTSGPVVRYVSTDELAKQLAYRTVDDPRLAACCDDATVAIDWRCGNIDAQFTEPIPGGINQIALSLAVDIWKQPDSSFGIIGLGETGLVRTPRDLVVRYDDQLLPYANPAYYWGVA